MLILKQLNALDKARKLANLNGAEMDGWMDGWMDGMDGWMNRWK